MLGKNPLDRDSTDKVMFNAGKFQSIYMAQLIYKASECFLSNNILGWYNHHEMIKANIDYKLEQPEREYLEMLENYINRFLSKYKPTKGFDNQHNKDNAQILNMAIKYIKMYQRRIKEHLDELGYGNPSKKSENTMVD